MGHWLYAKIEIEKKERKEAKTEIEKKKNRTNNYLVNTKF